MKAREITDATIRLMRTGKYRFGRINFANGDMVGHTGNIEAAMEALEIVDECMKKLMEVIDELGGVLIYTSDHGNADQMFTKTVDNETAVITSHSLAPVPFVIYDPLNKNEYGLTPPTDAGLSHIAATTLNLLGYQAPEDYQPSLIKFR